MNQCTVTIVLTVSLGSGTIVNITNLLLWSVPTGAGRTKSHPSHLLAACSPEGHKIVKYDTEKGEMLT